jgi:hypothetical protein
MMVDILSIEELRADHAELSKRMAQCQAALNGFASEGANITKEGVAEARETFSLLQCQIWIRSLQEDEFSRTGTLEGSLQNAIDEIVRHCNGTA